MTTHLLTRDTTACDSQARYPARSDRLADVTCTRCARAVDATQAFELERMRLARRDAEIRAVGFGEALAFVDGDTPSEEMVRNILGSLATYLLELGYRDDEVAA